MKRSLGSFLTVAAVVLVAPTFSGCALTQNSDGSVSLTSLTTYTGSPESKSVAYSAGQSVRIVSANGNVNVATGSAGQVGATFSPTTKGKGDSAGKKQAEDEMNNQIHYAVSQGAEIVIEVTRTGSNSYLGADVDVTIPGAFDGNFTVQQGNGFVDVVLGGGEKSVTVTNAGAGDIAVEGASGKLMIVGGFDVSVGVASWAPVGQDGSISAGDQLGSVDLRIPAATSGTMTAQADGNIVESGLPSGWQSAASAANSKSYTMGDGNGAKVSIVAGEDIRITAK